MLSSRILLFNITSMDALLVLCIYLYMNYFLHCFCICKTHVCSTLVEEIKNIIIILIIILIIIIRSFSGLITYI